MTTWSLGLKCILRQIKNDGVNSQFELYHDKFLDKNVIVPTCYKKCTNIYEIFADGVGGSWIDHVVSRGGWSNDHV